MISGDAQSTASQDTTVIREESFHTSEIKTHARTMSQIQRFDKLQQQEAKDMLLIFLFVVKYLNEEQMILWWQSFSETDVLNFFTILEMCLRCFKYVGRANLTAVKTSEWENGRSKTKKAHTLPARMNPAEINHEPTGTLVIHTARENLITSGKTLMVR